MRATLLFLVVTGCRSPEPPVRTGPNQLDTRQAVPLLPHMANHQLVSMRDHLVAVQEIVAGLASSDFVRVERAGARLGMSEQMGQMCNHMGMGAAGFAEQAIAFHQTADAIAPAARKRDAAEVHRALDATLQTCTACHAQWKQQVVDEETWARVTTSTTVPGH